MGGESDSPVARRGRINRAVPLLGLAGQTASAAAIASFRKRSGRGDLAEFHRRNAERYAAHFGRSKGVLMKLGQMMSLAYIGDGPLLTQNTYQRAFATLTDDAPPMPFDTALAVLETELGADADTVFTEFDPIPLAAASIGQVHAAQTHDGRRVAVKIQYPGVGDAIRADLRNLKMIANSMRRLNGMIAMTELDPNALAGEISARISEEIDYRIEATNQSAFAEIYRDHPFIHIPEIVPALSTKCVLTMDLVEGMRFQEALGADEQLRNAWAETIIRFVWSSLTRTGLLHGDGHPGNYLFHDDGSVTFLDFGYIKRHRREQVRVLQAATNATIDGDAAALRNAVREMNTAPADSVADPADQLAWFRAGLEVFAAPQPFTVTPEVAARSTRDYLSPRGPNWHVARVQSLDPEYITLERVRMAWFSMLGALRVTADWEAIRSEYDRDGDPSTPRGELDATFWASRAVGFLD